MIVAPHAQGACVLAVPPQLGVETLAPGGYQLFLYCHELLGFAKPKSLILCSHFISGTFLYINIF